MNSNKQTNPIKCTRTLSNPRVSNGIGGYYTQVNTYDLGQRYLLTHSASKTDTTKRKKPQGLALLRDVTTYSHSEYFVYDNASTLSQLIDGYTREEITATATYFHGSVSLLRPNVRQPNPDNLLLQKMKSVKGNLAMMLGEYRETCSLFEAACQTIYQVGVKIARRDYHGLASTFTGVGDDRLPTFWKKQSKKRRAADLYLGWQYGVLPLVDDVEKAAAGIYNAARACKPYYSKVVATDQKSGSIHRTDRNAFYWDNKYTSVDFWCHETRSRRHCAYVNYNPVVSRFTEFGLTNPLHLAWNLIPYSFIVDTMFNVGGYLSSLDAMVGIDSFFGYATQVNRYSGGRQGIGGLVTYEGREVSRASLSVPTPTLEYHPSDSLMQVVNGCALLGQLNWSKTK